MEMFSMLVAVLGGIGLLLALVHRLLSSLYQVLDKAIQIRHLLRKSKRKKDATPNHE